MTATQAAALRMKWNERMDPQPGEHLNLGLERSDHRYLTGNYICIVCGTAVAQTRA